jgi:hypothetical protein
VLGLGAGQDAVAVGVLGVEDAADEVSAEERRDLLLRQDAVGVGAGHLERLRLRRSGGGQRQCQDRRLMGKKPEHRFEYIQQNAHFAEELDL